MNRRMKKVLSIVCAITLIVSSMTGLTLTTVDAETTTTVIKTGTDERTALLAEIASSDYNFALGKNASVSQLTTTDGGTNLAAITDGTFATANSKTTIVEIGRGNKTDDPWVQIDLGNAYDTSKIDRIAVQYKTNNSGPKSGYYISYSLDGINFVTVAEVGAYAGSNNQIYLDKITLTENQATAIPYVKFIRVTSTTDNSAYGLQVKGMAVLTDGTTKVSEVGYQEVASLDNPESLTVTSSDFNQLEYSFEGAEGHDDFIYYAYVDNQLIEENAIPGTTYTVTGLTAGDHIVKICSFKDGTLSDGISQTITVTDTKSLLTSDRNLATDKPAKASSIRDNDKETSITDNILNVLFRTVVSDTQSYIVIDLEQNYRLDAIERVVGYYADNRYPTAYTIDFSLNGTDYETVTTAVGESTVQTAEVDVTNCTIPAVRYVRFNLSAPVAAGYGFQMFELGVIAKENADLTPVEVATVSDPAAFDVEVTGYNTADVTITAAEGQEDYKYNVYIDDVVTLLGVDAGTYTITDIEPGDKVFTVKSAYNGVTSEGISVTKTVQSAFTHTYETLAASVEEAGKAIEATKQVGDVTYNNYSLFMKATATATSEENATLVATNVLDGVTTTRWSSVASDPQNIIVDLGAEYEVCELDIVWQTASAKEYDIEYSTDGTNFTKVGTVYNGATGSRYDNLVLTETITARYIKINGQSRTGVYGYSIWDMGIYGPETEDTTPADVEGLAVTAGVAIWQASVYADTYKVYVGGQLVGETADLTYDLSEVLTADGDYVIGVQAVNAEGSSTIKEITITHDVEETTTPPADDVSDLYWEIQLPYGEGFQTSEYDGTGFEITDIPAGTEKWICGARLQNIPVEAGKTYTISFTVVSSVNKVVPVEFTNGTGAYINVSATPEGAVYSQTFTAQ